MNGPRSYLKLGDWNAVCYFCGAKRKASELVRYWQGFYVCKECWEPRQPQDFVRGTMDEQTPPWTQPLPTVTFTFTNKFIGTGDGVTKSFQLGDGLAPTTVTSVSVNNYNFTATAQLFGTWNGVTTSASLVDPFGHIPLSANVSAIHRTDWQGRQLLFPTLRQQYLDSAAPGGPGWGTTGSPTVTTDAATDPAGTSLATKIVTTAASDVYRFPTFGTPPQPSAGTITEYLWLKGAAGGEACHVGCDQPGATNGLAAATLTTSWARYASTFAWNDTGTLNIVLSLPAGVTVYAAFGQIEVASVPGSFIQGSVGSFPTITDYTLTGTTVNLAQAPAATAVTTWNGTGVSSGITPAYTVNSTGLITFSVTPAAGAMVYASGSEEMT